VAIDAKNPTSCTIQIDGKALSAGKHKIQLAYEGSTPMPYSLETEYRSTKPNSADQCSVKLEQSLSKDVLTEGESGEVTVKLTNVKTEPLPMVVAIIGLPGGLEPRHEKLKELVKTQKIDFYEIRGREVILYWRGMNPSGTVTLTIDVKAAIPGTYTGPSSRAYLYYTPEYKQWLDGFKVEIKPVDEKTWETHVDSAPDIPDTPIPTPSVQHSVTEWLDGHKLTEYKACFADAGYDDMEDLVELTEDELKEMGLEKVGHRKKILRLIQEWHEENQ